MKIVIIADCREDFPSAAIEKHYNDHYSKKSINEIQKGVQALGYKCNFEGGIETLIKYLYDKDECKNILFLNFSDGLTQKNRRTQAPLLLELLGANYSGSDPFSVGMVNDKYFTNKILKESNINVPKSFLYKNWKEDLIINYPVVVKPNTEGSSLGINQGSICNNESEVNQKISELLNKNYEPMIEEYIPGYEITNFIIGNPGNFVLNELIMSEYMNEKYFSNFVFGLEEKTSTNRVQKVLTEENSPFSILHIKELSCKIFNILGLRDLARIDYRVSHDGIPTFIEVNSLPVFSSTSEVGVICKFYNKSLSYVLELLINSSIKRLGIL